MAAQRSRRGLSPSPLKDENPRNIGRIANADPAPLLAKRERASIHARYGYRRMAKEA